MRHKYFLILALFAFILSGCKLNDYKSKEEIIVSEVLKSQLSLRAAGKQTQNFTNNDIYHAQNYFYDSHIADNILAQQFNVGSALMSGYYDERLQFSDLQLDFDVDNLTQDYIYDYRGYMYAAYQERYHFNTTQSFVGNAHNNPYKGTMEIEGAFQNLIVRVINAQDVQISVYDYHDSYQDRIIYTTWKELGF